MSPEQFIYWLSGYLTAHEHCENYTYVAIEDIKMALKSIKVNEPNAILFTTTEN